MIIFMLIVNTIITAVGLGVLGFTTWEYIKDRAFYMLLGVNLPLGILLILMIAPLWVIPLSLIR